MDKVKIAIIDSEVKNIIVRGMYQAAVKAVILLKKIKYLRRLCRWES